MIRKLACIFLVIGTVFFMTGLHSIDNGWNIQYLRTIDVHLIDQTFSGQILSAEELYSNGVMMCLFGFLLSVMASIFIFSPLSEKEPSNKKDEYGFC